MAYDPHDRPISVTDPNGNTTTYAYDGFGGLVEEVSPARGNTVYRYDPDGNLTQSIDANGAIANHTYDILDRVATTTYPADNAENVTYTYDQTGHGFGIGRLTSVTDAAGIRHPLGQAVIEALNSAVGKHDIEHRRFSRSGALPGSRPLGPSLRLNPVAPS